MAEAEWVNSACLVNCQGCNADRCCWEFATDDFVVMQCECDVFDGPAEQQELPA